MIDSLQKKLAFTDSKIESKATELKKLIESTVKDDNEKLLAALTLCIEKVEKSVASYEQLVSTIEVRTNLLEKSIADYSKSLKSLTEKVA